MANVELELTSAAARSVHASVTLLDLDRIVARAEATFRLPAGPSTRTIAVRLPPSGRHGYGIEATLTWDRGTARARGTSAVEALDGWWDSPRHAALTEFSSPHRTAAAATALRDWHVTVVQAYDWMYRHHCYTPPSGDRVFLDALGRRVSHDAVRAGVRAARDAGIATLAYGSVYGAERDYVDAHPDERVFDEAGNALSLGETFYINDLRPGRPWRERLLLEYDRAMRTFGFDGIHMDTYGPPHRGVSHDGEAIDFSLLYPGLIADGARTVAAARDGGRVLFNCVEGFPLEQVATAPAAAIYLELWPPDVDYADIVRWIERARALGEGRAVVIAAYISALRSLEADPVGRAGAVEAAVLLTSVIAAAGAYHHVLAERDRVLVEGYYPEARRLRGAERRELRAAWEFTARYVHLLSDPGLRLDPAGESAIELLDPAGSPVPVSSGPRSGAVWVRAVRLPDGGEVLQLIDLLDQDADRWDDRRQPSPGRSSWTVRWGDRARPAPVAMSPWTAGGRARRLSPAGSSGVWRIPRFRRWIVLARRPG